MVRETSLGVFPQAQQGQSNAVLNSTPGSVPLRGRTSFRPGTRQATSQTACQDVPATLTSKLGRGRGLSLMRINVDASSDHMPKEHAASQRTRGHAPPPCQTSRCYKLCKPTSHPSDHWKNTAILSTRASSLVPAVSLDSLTRPKRFMANLTSRCGQSRTDSCVGCVGLDCTGKHE